MYQLVWQNPDAAVIYKKPGTSFHSEAGEPGLFETLRQSEGFDELYPVHRLDKLTSGLLVVAKNAAANRALCDQFAAGMCEKFYLALSEKKPVKKQGTVSGDMAPGRRGSWLLTRSRTNPAVTQFFSWASAPGQRLYLVRPLTGKTHQIRVALKSAGAPILGDERYGGAAADRGYLHAYSLGFTLGDKFFRFTEAPREGEAFLQPAVQDLLAEHTYPWSLPWPRA